MVYVVLPQAVRNVLPDLLSNTLEVVKLTPSVIAGVSIGVMVAFFLMFEVWFKVPLYKGTLDPLRFLGY